MSNARNSRTTHPRRAARRQRAAERFHVNVSNKSPAYWTAKEREAKALGLDFSKVERRHDGTTSLGDLMLRKAARDVRSKRRVHDLDKAPAARSGK